MQSRTRLLVVVGLTGLAFLGPGAISSEAQVAIESVFPAQIPRGQATVVNVAVPGRDLVAQAVEIAPAAGVTVSGLKRVVESQGIAWWEFTVDVAADAAPGDRSLVLVLPAGRSLPVTIAIPAHVPRISDLKVVSARPGQATVEVEFAVADPSADLGTSPYVWFTTGCAGGEGIVGAVRGTVSAGRVRAVLPSPRSTGAGTPPAGPCDLRVRGTDASGIESNTLTTAIEFRN
jgi:hypothetical protein